MKKTTLPPIIFILSLIIILINIIQASPVDEPWEITGYVYVDGTNTKPDGIALLFPSGSNKAILFDDGHYLIKISDDKFVGETGTFEVIINNKIWDTPQTVTIEENNKSLNLDLNFSSNENFNQPPIADAGGPYYATIDVLIIFNGTGSIDTDGTIAKYEWDFGDGTTTVGVLSTHTYQEVGKYTIILTVIDNEGDTDFDINYAYISEALNFPPTKPSLSGEPIGSVNTLYNYTIFSTDIENDTIQYIFDWGDETDVTISNFLDNGTIFYANHTWAYPGIYNLSAYVIDENNLTSEQTEITVLIDSIFCGTIGYMIDFTSDSIYDLFHSNTTDEETPVKFVNDLYLIDDNNDGKYDYQFDITTKELSVYSQVGETKEQETNWIDMINPYLPYIIIGVLALLIIIIFLFIREIKQEPKKKVYYTKEKNKIEVKEPKAKEILTKIKFEKSKSIEEEIDELLSNKK